MKEGTTVPVRVRQETAKRVGTKVAESQRAGVAEAVSGVSWPQCGSAACGLVGGMLEGGCNGWKS